jgi:hypothetical protein
MQHSPSTPALDLSGSGDAQVNPLVSEQRPQRSSPIFISSPRRRSFNVHSATPHSLHSEHQWSLFGQLMESEGHLRITPASVSNTSRRSSSPGDYFARRSSILSESTHSPLRPFAQPREASPGPGHADPALHGLHVETTENDSDDDSPTSDRDAWFAWILQPRRPRISLIWRNVFKCAIAYFVASLFTFSPYLSDWIAPFPSDSSKSPSPSGHMVATM